MRVVILHNPRSGSGRAERRADAADAALGAAGFSTTRVAVGADSPLTPTSLADTRCLVVSGGDGTVLRAAPAAIDAGCPLYHLPAGNENLFARSFGMTDQPDQIVAALRAGNTAEARIGALRAHADNASAHGPTDLFLLMASVGPDAGVIRRLASARTRPTGHAAYTLPLLAELLRPLIPHITLDADGRRRLDARPGWLLVANARAYALRLDPVPDADILADGLDFVFIPATTGIGAALALARAHRRPGRWLRGRAEHLVITAESSRGPCCQIDGEIGLSGQRSLALDITAARQHLPVLVPA